MEKALLRTDSMNILRDFEKLPQEGKDCFMSLHAWHPNSQVDKVHAIFNANA